jgi:hypothetical protein
MCVAPEGQGDQRFGKTPHKPRTFLVCRVPAPPRTRPVGGPGIMIALVPLADEREMQPLAVLCDRPHCPRVSDGRRPTCASRTPCP